MKDDTISRAAAIDAMMKLQTEDIEAYGASIPEGFDGDRAVTALKALPPAQPGWIPVTERLPRPNEEDGNGFYKAYLVQDGRWMDVARWDGKYWVAWGYSTVLLNVVAWCELPTPYREGGQDEAEQ